MSQSDPNAPLPRMKKATALQWAKDYTAYMAEITDVELRPSTAKIYFEACVGENDEVAEDGRYSLFYYVRSSASTTKHAHVVRTLRRQLPRHGYKVTSYREFKSAYTNAVFRARNLKNDYSVSANSMGSSESLRFTFGVRTPCMLPPGVKQQQF